ncbi:hypothetical protein FVEN_g12946 [Fusarium venenatum]|nr:hypothetical protein FVEN_g12946 [Fusarium venenatum]
MSWPTSVFRAGAGAGAASSSSRSIACGKFRPEKAIVSRTPKSLPQSASAMQAKLNNPV